MIIFAIFNFSIHVLENVLLKKTLQNTTMASPIGLVLNAVNFLKILIFLSVYLCFNGTTSLGLSITLFCCLYKLLNRKYLKFLIRNIVSNQAF